MSQNKPSVFVNCLSQISYNGITLTHTWRKLLHWDIGTYSDGGNAIKMWWFGNLKIRGLGNAYNT